jgi:NAD(P)-dependent dehydrogenase (short-subunit alcohol dehydrogenase family)
MSRIKKLFDLKGKVAIITGASKGIGESMAWGLAEHGAAVVVSSRKQQAVDKVAGELKSEGHLAKGIQCHVGKDEDLETLVQKTIEEFGKIDVLINNAGTNPYFGPIQNLTAEAYRKTLEINLDAALKLSNLVYPHMKNSGGSIIHISSIEGLHASAYFSAYNISKAGLIMLAKNQAVEWGKENIRVNAICPGFVKTKLSSGLWQNEELSKKLVNAIPLGRYAQPDEMAGLAVFLSSDASSYLTGTTIVNDGGLLNAQFF